jgi:phage FluMu protein Com
LIEVRCKNCGKLLGWFEGKGEVKCPRTSCGVINSFDVSEMPTKKMQNHISMKNRTTSSGATFH